MDRNSFDSKNGLSSALLEAERARRVQATLGVVVMGLKKLDHLKQDLGDDGITEIMEQCLDRIRANVRRVDLVTMLDEHMIAVISVDRNENGPQVLARKVFDVLKGTDFTRMGMPVNVEIAVGGTCGQPEDEKSLEKFIGAAKESLGSAMESDPAFHFEA